MDPIRHSDLSTPKLAFASRERISSALPWVQSEPIAIVGLGCRFPGADGPEELLTLLQDGIDAVRDLPEDRWDRERYHDPDPDAPGKTYVTRAGYLDDISSFDASRFGIAPAEALRMDPQQRLLLEVSWHALEHAAIAPESLYGTPTGVFVGISGRDYASLLHRTTSAEEIDGYVATGNAFSVAAGRISYVLGLNGPSLAVDTACSSSLVSVHLAIQSLRLRECEVALAGGVNLLLEPESTIDFSKARMLAPDGRVKAFDSRANGFVRGEGCGVIVLKRLSDALAAGDDVWAVIRGSAINQDGASSGLTAPNGTAQRAVLKAALENAGVEPQQVGFVEGHGTGTALGDPIELGALAEVYGVERAADQPLRIGSIKTNIGHLESAAGIAGLIKAVLALRYRELPGQLHFESPSTHVDWMRSGLEVVRKRRKLEPIEGRYLAAVSSFGFSGTNAHMLLEASPEFRLEETCSAGPHAILLGAQNKERLDRLAERWAQALERTPEADLPAVARSAWAGRNRGPERFAVSGTNGPELAANLHALREGRVLPGTARGRVRRGAEAGKLAFLFSGQGSAWVGMGLDLRDREPVFRDVLERCAVILGEQAWLDPTRIEPDQIIDTGDAQPALFAFEIAMAELLRSRGLEPDYVLGHSVGELAAAYVAGVLELEEAAHLVRARAEHMSALPAGGKMVAVIDDPARVQRAVREAAGDVSVAAFNGPRQTVVSGPADAVDALITALKPEEARTLRVSHAFHSALMEPALDKLHETVASVRFKPPRIPLVSSRTGALAGSEIGRPDYWVRQLREPVRFGDAVDTLWTSGVQELVEVGPGASLSGLARKILADDPGVLAIPTATRRRGELLTLMDAVAALSVRRDDRDLGSWLGDGPRSSSAPRTPFVRTRIWPAMNEAEEQDEQAAKTSKFGERLPIDRWGWTPSFRRLAPPSAIADPKDSVVVLGDHKLLKAHELVAALKGRSTAVTRHRLDEIPSLDFASEDAPSRLVVFPPADGSKDWAAELVQALSSSAFEKTLFVITFGAHEVTGDEPLDPQAAADAAIGSVIAQELAQVKVRRIDLHPSAPSLPRTIVDEVLSSLDGERVVAYRGTHRWALDHVSAPLTPAASAQETSASSSDTIALIGRLTGGLGERIAGHLLRRGVKRLIAIGPGVEEGLSSAIAEETEAVRRLRKLAGREDRIVARAADVGDAQALTDILKAMEADYGAIDGVIHAGASGRPEIARLLVQEDRPATAALARERIDGMPALAEAIGQRDLRYVLVVTSLSAHVGGVAFADYSAANAYAETFVLRHAREAKVPWSTVAFEALAEEIGHGVDRLSEGSILRQLALTDADIEQALGRLNLLSSDHVPAKSAEIPPSGTFMIVPTDAAQRVERAHAPVVVTMTESDGVATPLGGAEARDEVEKALVKIWEELLATRPIGIHDDYFALGGTSIAAVQILSRVKARFSVDLPLEALLGKEPTIAAIADTVRELSAAVDHAREVGSENAELEDVDLDSVDELAEANADLEELLMMVEQLSPDEAEKVLADEGTH